MVGCGREVRVRILFGHSLPCSVGLLIVYGCGS